MFQTFNKYSLLWHVLNISYIWIAGMRIEFPSPYEIKNKFLEMEYKEVEAHVNQQREKWKTYGCTIMSNGWIGPTKLSIINFMVYSKGITVFLKSIDASNNIKDHKYIYKLLKTVIKEVDWENVVQIVIDNGSVFVKVEKPLMKKFNLYWTLCVAHYINLIFEDIGKKPSVIDVINNGCKITDLTYNHGWLLAQMRKYLVETLFDQELQSLLSIILLLTFFF